MSFFPRFWKWLQFADKQGALKVTFSFFFCRKNASFQYSCVKVVKVKKCKSQGTRPRVTCAREKPLFFEQNVTLIMSAPSRRNSPDFCIPFCSILAPKWDDSLQLMWRGWHSHQDTMISPREFASKLYCWVVLQGLVCKISGRCRWNFTFSPFFLSLLPYRPI